MSFDSVKGWYPCTGVHVCQKGKHFSWVYSDSRYKRSIFCSPVTFATSFDLFHGSAMQLSGPFTIYFSDSGCLFFLWCPKCHPQRQGSGLGSFSEIYFRHPAPYILWKNLTWHLDWCRYSVLTIYCEGFTDPVFDLLGCRLISRAWYYQTCLVIKIWIL